MDRGIFAGRASGCGFGGENQLHCMGPVTAASEKALTLSAAASARMTRTAASLGDDTVGLWLAAGFSWFWLLGSVMLFLCTETPLTVDKGAEFVTDASDCAGSRCDRAAGTHWDLVDAAMCLRCTVEHSPLWISKL